MVGGKLSWQPKHSTRTTAWYNYLKQILANFWRGRSWSKASNVICSGAIRWSYARVYIGRSRKIHSQNWFIDITACTREQCTWWLIWKQCLAINAIPESVGLKFRIDNIGL